MKPHSKQISRASGGKVRVVAIRAVGADGHIAATSTASTIMRIIHMETQPGPPGHQGSLPLS